MKARHTLAEGHYINWRCSDGKKIELMMAQLCMASLVRLKRINKAWIWQKTV